MEADFSKNGGLLSVILQETRTKQVLMNGYMNEEALTKTKEDGVVWFYSRSKERLWKKGETSGHIQKVISMKLDCDQDALLIEVDPHGPTCHTGTQSCFGDEYFNLSVLDQTVQKKLQNPEEGSYTKYLKEQGIDKILKKCGEEMTEVVLAAKNKDRENLIDESSDLLYHFLVLLNHEGLSLKDVEKNLEERHGKKQDYSIRDDIKKW
jgi:phosphoribosyl-ATP pyrophosphohydrolase/phosphoribosyl-AMP cyclohydrolase